MPTAEELVEALGWAGAPGYLPPRDFDRHPAQAHLFRRAALRCAVRAIYVVGSSSSRSVTPAVYLSEAASAQDADEIHARVWNQGAAPFLLVALPDGIRLYSGSRPPSGEQAGVSPVLEMSRSVHAMLDRLPDLRARAIDEGMLWRRPLDLDQRIDRRLLDNLSRLGTALRKDLSPERAHALIGRFVYLRYLRDRGLLGDDRLGGWGLEAESVFGRRAEQADISRLFQCVDDWINGTVFPVELAGPGAPTLHHLRMLSDTFLGDDPESGQLHLPFRAYDFSVIPIELLSVIYEQFLHHEGRGRGEGAYYTPLPLVNLVLDELDGERPWVPGTRLLDPSCGSGAFLVQGYRRMIEHQRRESGDAQLSPWALRRLLEDHVFGVDRDLDACRVAALSLSLALLDAVPEESVRALDEGGFKLPGLLDCNIACSDLFDEGTAPAFLQDGRGFGWIAGNPPWKSVSEERQEDQPLYRWMTAAKAPPVVAMQAAEAFAWQSLDLLSEEGLCGLVMPASTLFNDGAMFRERFFQSAGLRAVVNLANLREVLFSGPSSLRPASDRATNQKRARKAAAVIFYTKTPAHSCDPVTWSPLLARQTELRGREGRRRRPVWALDVNADEVHTISFQDVATGSGLPWKTAMWGGMRDLQLVQLVEQGWPMLQESEQSGLLRLSEGVQLQEAPPVHPERSHIHHPELAGALELVVSRLARLGGLYALPPGSLVPLPEQRTWLRRRGGVGGLKICQPPHILVDGARRFAVFTDEYVIVPRPHHGIAAGRASREHLVALSLYLSSDVVTWHQFLRAPEAGVREGRATLQALRKVPDPITSLSATELRPWVELHAELVQASRARWPGGDPRLLPLLEKLEAQLQDLVHACLGLQEWQRWLVEDLVRVKRLCADSKVPRVAIEAPKDPELYAYAVALQAGLADFFHDAPEIRHEVIVHHDRADGQGLVQVRQAPGFIRPAPLDVRALDRSDAAETSRLLKRIRQEHGQWLHFDRNLIIHTPDATWIAKPLERLSWLRSQALADADRIIADALAPGRA